MDGDSFRRRSGGSYGAAEPIGSPRRLVAPPHYDNSLGAYAMPITARTVIVQPRRRH